MPRDEEAFIAAYRSEVAAYPKAANTVDVLIFSFAERALQVLLVKRREPPFQGQWALPGGFVDVGDALQHQGESLVAAARRVLQAKAPYPAESSDTDIADDPAASIPLEQLYTFGDPHRDPRMRVITVVYYALVPPDVRGQFTQEAADDTVRWWPVTPELSVETAFDHAEIIALGLERLRGKLDYSPLAFRLVPERFTTSELRSVHEVIKGEVYDQANFNRRFRRMQQDGIIVDTGEKRQTGRRPAKLFRFVDEDRRAADYRVSSVTA